VFGGCDGEAKIALEATYGWEWLAELLEDHGYKLRLAHPLRTEAIASAPAGATSTFPDLDRRDASGLLAQRTVQVVS
jgi:transposase